jgi:hypothetical protein
MGLCEIFSFYHGLDLGHDILHYSLICLHLVQELGCLKKLVQGLTSWDSLKHVYDISPIDQKDGRNRSDIETCGQLWQIINVELHHFDFAIQAIHLLCKEWKQLLAWSTPLSVTVKDDWDGLLHDFGLPFSERLELIDQLVLSIFGHFHKLFGLGNRCSLRRI